MKLGLFFLSTFILGLVSGITLSNDDPILKTGSDVNSQSIKGDRDPAKSGSSVHPSVLNRISRLEHQIKILTTRFESFQSIKSKASHRIQDRERSRPIQTADELFAVLKEAMDSEDSEVRQTVGEIVRDEFKNMRSEWSAFRSARGEARDEELLNEFQGTTDLSERERDTMADFLQTERTEIGALRRRARETFDVKGGREATKARRLKTDEAMRELLGSERAETWQRLRESRRPPWRR